MLTDTDTTLEVLTPSPTPTELNCSAAMWICSQWINVLFSINESDTQSPISMRYIGLSS